ncbi:hypothetical protein PGT21_019778 [Puccinia graminis f. sp. tritici]|uniref:CCHC-type domain-containing protein n=1 Tax=Puccinia graminis f. sp. tritici TaxID=56615 RepID=A0A5B0Q357_PUCGR|nr:hypothetical protein PGT21_019778 [Puccinia graminis f. sp. tritici]
MPIRTLNNPSHLIPSVPVLDGNSVTFAAWRSRLLDVLSVMNVLDIVDKSLLRPSDNKDSKTIGRSPDQKGYNPEDFAADWDALSDMARSTIKLTLSVDLAIRYAKWIARIRKAASDLNTSKIAPADQQVCDQLLRGLDDSWKTIRDHLVYSPKEVSLDDAIGALEAHKLLTTPPPDQFGFDGDASVSAAKAKWFGCYNCGNKGHHSSRCSKPPKKNKATAQANSIAARAGATSTVPLGFYGPEEDGDDDNSFDDEIDVVWGYPVTCVPPNISNLNQPTQTLTQQSSLEHPVSMSNGYQDNSNYHHHQPDDISGNNFDQHPLAPPNADQLRSTFYNHSDNYNSHLEACNNGGFDDGSLYDGVFEDGGFEDGGFEEGGFDDGGFDNGGFDNGGFDDVGFDDGGFDDGYGSTY